MKLGPPTKFAEVAKLEDATDLGSVGEYPWEFESPPRHTQKEKQIGGGRVPPSAQQKTTEKGGFCFRN